MNLYPEIYHKMLKAYGLQGWWPLVSLHNKGGVNPTKSGSVNGYHPGDYSYPKNEPQRFEICIGAILTQNTSWPNVEKAMLNLFEVLKEDLFDAKMLLELSDDALRDAIRPAGYFNQKAKKLRIFAEFFLSLEGRTPSRDELLSLWGIGPETADSILLYAYGVTTFVVDAYTRRLLVSLGLISGDESYDEVKFLFEKNLKSELKIYQEFHALIVEHEKRRKSGFEVQL